jgi:GR25 family glycosyltransferase involved in LPS biosynthesis
MIDWKSKFDKIYCLHYLPNKDRVDNIYDELKKVGLLDTDIFEWYITYPSGMDEIKIKSLLKYKNGPVSRHFGKGAYNCTLGHYSIIKTAYELGYNHIMIMEDDIEFLNDTNIVENIINNIPDDYNVISFDIGNDGTNTPYENMMNIVNNPNNKINDYFVKYNHNMGASSGCYALSRKGMKHIIDGQERKFMPADYYTSNEHDSFLITWPNIMCIQRNYSKCMTNTNTNIDWIGYLDKMLKRNRSDYEN